MDTPTPPNPAKAAKSLTSRLKGHSPVVYAAVIAGGLGFAYYLHKRDAQTAGTQDSADVYSPDDSGTVPVVGPDYDPSQQYTYFPSGSQGAFMGSDFPAVGSANGQPNGAPASPSDLTDLIGAFGDLWAIAHPVTDAPITASPTGGGAPAVPPTNDVHLPPDTAPASPPSKGQPFTPTVTAREPQPILGPNIYYNADRHLRYVIKEERSPSTHKLTKYRRYESRLNRGDWGQGGVIPV